MLRVLFNYIIPPLLIIAALYITVPKFMDKPETISADEAYEEAPDYITLNITPNTSTPINVIEVFAYSCPHCNDFRYVFDKWKKQRPEGITVEHIPAMWNDHMEQHARIFYTVKALNKFDKMHKDVFSAIHFDHLKLVDEDEIYSLFAKHNVDKNTFKQTFYSTKIDAELKRAKSLASRFEITGTPTMVVNEKYLVSSATAGSQERALLTAEILIEKDRLAKNP